ncbi:sulfonate transport system ATP-binding protein [Lampropedia hyalina DSM 16112]|jgi:sulfonate transport system ATP-binding protein|uniref:Sulfonate transport system ATP-binding protein n=1 Tax=Lampropedia hyalina DSM 16112 TaxID=1122156 RepID=A0A1M4SM92_9BURK|nr:ABC transporter ATP-binding protein [Lampropedia hyalina]SHE33340.1 sulfonate transport system ATP-binding protein [Lampropedia hyalina DSM 16112]
MATELRRELKSIVGAVQPTDAALSVRVRGLVRRFGEREVIKGLDLDIAKGEFVALLGASGCGKSTLLRILADLDHDIEGEVFVARRRAVAFQAPRLFPWKRVWRNVVTGLASGRDRASANVALEEVGLLHRGDAWPKDLSGGEAQRAALARALVRKPELLLLDEPFGALDALTRLKAQALVSQLWQRHRQAVLFVTHDVDEALTLADRIFVMREGVLAHEVQVSLDRPRSHADPIFTGLRSQLLAWLGVAEEAANVGTSPIEESHAAHPKLRA